MLALALPDENGLLGSAATTLNAFAGGTLNHDVFENDLKVTSLALPPSSAVDLPQLNFGAGEPVLLEGTFSLGSGVPRIPNTCLILPLAGGLDVAVCTLGSGKRVGMACR